MYLRLFRYHKRYNLSTVSTNIRMCYKNSLPFALMSFNFGPIAFPAMFLQTESNMAIGNLPKQQTSKTQLYDIVKSNKGISRILMKDPWDSHSEEAEIYSLTSTLGMLLCWSWYKIQYSAPKYVFQVCSVVAQPICQYERIEKYIERWIIGPCPQWMSGRCQKLKEYEQTPNVSMSLYLPQSDCNIQELKE